MMTHNNGKYFIPLKKSGSGKVWISGWAIFWLGLCLTGCATRGTAIPQEGATMAQVYEEAMQSPRGELLAQARQDVRQQVALSATPPTLSTETKALQPDIPALFPVLPNPQVVMYVYPHLAGDEQLPIPGYATAFPFYEKTHYALPGEVMAAAH